MKKIFSLILSVLFIMSFASSTTYASHKDRATKEIIKKENRFNKHEKQKKEREDSKKIAKYIEKNYRSPRH